MNETEEELVVDLEEIGEKYEVKGFFRRLSDMFKGLGEPHDTREYKLARIELQRLAAPLIAIVTVVLFVVVLIVVTAVNGTDKEKIDFTVAKPEEEEPILEEEVEPPPDDIEPPPLEDIEIVMDNPNPGPVSEITPVAAPPAEQVSVKPAPQDAVAITESPIKMKSMVASRTTGAIGRATGGGDGYGDQNTEACILKVLWWLKATQNSDGSWGGGGKHVTNDSKLADTAFAVLTYLAHGEYPGSDSKFQKDFGPVVKNAIGYLMEAFQSDGNYKHARGGGDSHEYSYLIATYALCEAYGMTKNLNCKETAEKCMERIIKSQSPTGGWDYNLNKGSTRDDLSFGGWAIQALKAGKMAGLHPYGLDECIKKAIRCLKERSFYKGHFRYTGESGNGHTGLTGTGCLAMQLLGYGNDAAVRSALEYMKGWKPSFKANEFANGNEVKGNSAPQYYCYYATQCKFQAGMKDGAIKADTINWQQWNVAMKKYYTTKITDLPNKVKDWSGKEHKQGYFLNEDNWSSGITMDSCLAALQLMVYYRYLPTSTVEAGKVGEADDGGGAAGAVDKDDIGIDIPF